MAWDGPPPDTIHIIYSGASKIPRRIIYLDPGQTIDGHIGPGEKVLSHPSNSEHSDVFKARQRIADHHGIDVATIPSGRCALVHPDTGLVEDFVMACDQIDTHPTHKLIASDVAELNWKHDGKKFLKRFVVVPK